jgi:uracil-DNA glycosylase family 4
MGLELVYRTESTLTTHASRYDFHYRRGCDACPLRKSTPKVDPYGSPKPVVYMLGEAPGRDEVKEGRPFVGVAGRMLRKHLPKHWSGEGEPVRWNNCLMSRPPDNRTPTPQELASCRGYLEEDLLKTRPEYIFGFGAVPLSWFGIAESGITAWAGRYLPVSVGDHTCWYFPMMHPSYVNRSVDEAYKESRDRFKSEIEFAFHKHLQQAFALVDSDALGTPVVHTRSDAMADIAWPTRHDRDSANRIVKFIESLYDEDVVGLDYETNAIRPYRNSIIRPQHPDAKILSVSLSGSQCTMAWPVHHREARWDPKDLDMIEDAYARFLEKSECYKVAHSLPFEYEWTAIFYGKGIIRTPYWGDSLSQAYILDERPGSGSGPGPFSLDWLTRQYFGFSIKALNPVDRSDLDNVPLREVLPYNGGDAKYHRLVYLKQRERLKREGLMGTYKEHMRRVRAAVFTAIKGLPVNPDTNERLTAKYTTKRDAIYKEILALDAAKEFFSSKGKDLRPGSNPDCMFLMDKILPAKATKKARDKKGAIANAAEGTLGRVNHPIAKLILEWRKQNKVISTYLTPMREGSELIFDDGLLHPVTRTERTRTWRTSSDSPNYQNWNKRDPERREVREQVEPGKINGKKHVVVSLDYAGIQARNVAMESKDPELVKAFRTRYDIHSDWTEQMALINPSWFAEGVKELAHNKTLFKAYRNRIKNEFVFPSFFGAKAETTAHYMGVDDAVGRKLQGMFWGRFGQVFDWHESLFKMYRKHGYVTGLSGFRRRAPISANELINTPIQSDEAIIVCDAMSRLCELRRPALQPNMEIHDDLSFIWPEDKVDEYARIVLDVMLNCPFEWAQIVPLGVELSVGDNWFKQKAVGEYFTDTWKGEL